MKSFCVLNKPLNKKTGEALGTAAVGTLGNKIGFLHDDSECSAATVSNLAKGVKSAGASAVVFGCMNESSVSFLIDRFSLSGAFFVGGEKLISVYNSLGKPLSVHEEEVMSSLIFSSGTEKKRGGSITIINPTDSYLRALVGVPQSLEDISVAFESRNKNIKRTLNSVLNLLGGYTGAKPRFCVSESGFCVSACDESGRVITNDDLLNICAACAIKKKREICVLFSAPRFLDELAEKYGVKLERSFDGGNEPWQNDGLFLVAEILNNMAEQGMGLSALYSLLPAVSHKRKSIFVADGLTQFADSIVCDELISDDSGGIYMRMKQGEILFTPYRNSQKVCMEVLAANSETAEEIAADVYKLLST